MVIGAGLCALLLAATITAAIASSSATRWKQQPSRNNPSREVSNPKL
jgi:hypothetical protein